MAKIGKKNAAVLSQCPFESSAARAAKLRTDITQDANVVNPVVPKLNVSVSGIAGVCKQHSVHHC